MTTDTATTVHVVVPHFQAISEFAGHNDDCGPCANEVCTAAVQGRAPTTANMNAIRQRDLAHTPQPLFTVGSGQTIEALMEDAQTYGKLSVVLTKGTAEQVHEALKAAMLRGNPCVLNLALAGALPGNQPGIHCHFVAVGGIDSALGYLVANGDEYPFSHVGTYWVKWPDIEKAQPFALLEYHMPPKPTTPVPTIEDQLKIQNQALQAKIAAAQKALA